MESEETRIDRVVNFNYVDNLNECLQESAWNMIPVSHLHGTTNYMELLKNTNFPVCQPNDIPERMGQLMKSNSMVIGIDGIDKNEEFGYVRKYRQRTSKRVDYRYMDWLQGANRIYIYGHSLDYLDKEILEMVFPKPSPTTSKIVIFYHNESARDQYETNLKEFYDTKEYINNTQGENKKIEFKEQQDAKG